MYLAHSGHPLAPEGQPLREHLHNVAIRASECFFDAGMQELARLVGWYHDAGKYKLEVQNHIQYSTNEKIDHATLGAQLIADIMPNQLLASAAALSIMGHHGGIPNGAGADGNGRSMDIRLRDPLHKQAAADFNNEISSAVGSVAPVRIPIRSRKTLPAEAYMAIRMLHSALVDADYLDTEQFYDPYQAELRGKRPALAEMMSRYGCYMQELREKPVVHGTATIVKLRNQIQQWCLAAADKQQGFFSLSVPTGGGKTLATLGFALQHAEKYRHIKRVIYAIPFTSIIEQNAQVFRAVLGDDAVLEHHSAVALPENGTITDHAADNWDAPLIVTTNVQLFESIFSNKPSRSRKLHNLQDSVIILDELQALPDDVLKPCLALLDVLVKDYRVTVVLCTATQPDYSMAWVEPPPIFEMIPGPQQLFEAMRRTRAVQLGTLEDETLTARLAEHEQVLCIVNSRPYAQKLARDLGGEATGTYHLSTMMCPAHRTHKLALIRQLLEQGRPCRLISTSLIEAGVDVDFPVVYREMAGLDSIAQSAGRCNRNGKIREPAPVYLFRTKDKPIPQQVKRLAGITMGEVAVMHEELLSPAAMQQYFAIRFGSGANLDKENILQDIWAHEHDLLFPFDSIAERFRMIQSVGEPVYIPYDEVAAELIDKLRDPYALGMTLRRLQPYGVTVYDQQLQELQQRGFLQKQADVWILDVPPQQLQELYTDDYGLDVQAKLSLLLLE